MSESGSAENDAGDFDKQTCACLRGTACEAHPAEKDGRCPSMDPYGSLQCGRRVHEDTQCHFGGIAWKKGTSLPSPVPTVLYHWSPSRNRVSIEREGLRPGAPSNTFPEWAAPHVCYGETPAAALALTLLDDELDLWMVRTDGHAFASANEGQEWRCGDRVEAWWVGTRPPRDPVVDMTPAEQAEADDIVAYLHEEDFATRVIPPATTTHPTQRDQGDDA